MTKRLNKGFTLIELLVVIAIIGILSSVVLASLNTARTKGSDAAVKSDLNNIRAQTEIYYDNTSSTYGSAAFGPAVCPVYAGGSILANPFAGDQNVAQGIAHAVATGRGGSSCVSINTPATIWAAAVDEKSAGKAWCVDSSGQSREFSGTAAAAITAGKCN